jgi:hypothetical protein
MKKSLWIVLSLMFLNLNAHAANDLTIIPLEDMTPSANDAVTQNEEPTPVNTDRLKLVGRGVRHGGDSMALGCLDELCTKARMVYFEAGGKATYFGRTFTFSSDGVAPTEEQVKSSLEKLSQQYRQVKQSHSMVRRIAFALVGVGAVVGVAILTGSTIIFLGTLGGFAMLHQSDYHPNIHLGENPVVATFNNKDGWSWSVKPKRVSAKAFGNLAYVVKFYSR